MGLDVTAVAALLVSSCGGGGGQEDDSAADTTTAGDAEQAPEDALDAALKQSFRESDAPGVVAAVQTPEYTWVRALGVADRASKEPMTPDVHHRIGSVTKTFTATLSATEGGRPGRTGPGYSLYCQEGDSLLKYGSSAR